MARLPLTTTPPTPEDIWKELDEHLLSSVKTTGAPPEVTPHPEKLPPIKETVTEFLGHLEDYRAVHGVPGVKYPGLSDRAKRYFIRQIEELWPASAAKLTKLVEDAEGMPGPVAEYYRQEIDRLANKERIQRLFSKPFRFVGSGLMSVLYELDRFQDMQNSVFRDAILGLPGHTIIENAAKTGWENTDVPFSDVWKLMPEGLRRTIGGAVNGAHSVLKEIEIGSTKWEKAAAAPGRKAEFQAEIDRLRAREHPSLEGVDKAISTIGEFMLDPVIYGTGAAGLMRGLGTKFIKSAQLMGVASRHLQGAQNARTARVLIQAGMKAGEISTASVGYALRGLGMTEPFTATGMGLSAFKKGALGLAYKSPALRATLHKYALRGTGVKEIDAAKDLAIGFGPYHMYESGLVFDIKRLEKSMASLPEELKFLVPTLAEERRALRSVEAIQKFREAVRQPGRERWSELMTPELFHNPKAVRRFVELGDDAAAEVADVASDFRRIMDKTTAMRQLEGGQELADLSTKFAREGTRQTKRFVRAYPAAIQRNLKKQQELVKSTASEFDEATKKAVKKHTDKARATVASKKAANAEFLMGLKSAYPVGSERWKKLWEAAERNAFDSVKLATELGKEHSKIAYRALERWNANKSTVEALEASSYRIIMEGAMKEPAVTKAAVGAHKALKAGLPEARAAAQAEPAIKKIRDEIVRNWEIVEDTPNWVRHYMDLKSTKRLARWMRREGKTRDPATLSPFTGSNIERKFVEMGVKEGRPLSFEEVIRELKRSERWPLQAERPLTKYADLYVLPEEILYKPEGIKRKAGRLIRGALGRDSKTTRELAEFFSTSPEVILKVAATETSRSLSGSEFFHRFMDTFGMSPKKFKEVQKAIKEGTRAKEKAHFVQLGEASQTSTPELREMLRLHPEYKDWRVPAEFLPDFLQASTPFFNPGSLDLAMKAWSDMKGWWVTYTLALFPSWHVRNAQTNIWKLTYRGMFQNPAHYPRDLSEMVTGYTIQTMVTAGNPMAARSVAIFSPALNRNIDGFELFKVGIRTGAIRSSFMANEMARLLKTARPHEKWKEWFPLTNYFKPARAGLKAGEWIDEGARFTLFIHEIQKGATPQRAASIVKKILGDFRREMYTPFEAKYMTQAIPFWSWMRYNIPMELYNFIYNPTARRTMMAYYRAYDEFLRPEGMLKGGRYLAGATPDHIRNMSALPTRKNPETGEAEWGATEGWIAPADLGNLMGTMNAAKFLVSSLHPLLGFGIEAATGTDVYTGEPLREKRFFGHMFPPLVAAAMNRIRLITALNRSDPANLWSDPATAKQTWKARMIRELTGFKTYKTKPYRDLQQSLDESEKEMREVASKLRNAMRAALDYEDELLEYVGEKETGQPGDTTGSALEQFKEAIK